MNHVSIFSKKAKILKRRQSLAPKIFSDDDEKVETYDKLQTWMSFASDTPLPWTKALPTVGTDVLLQVLHNAQHNHSNWFPCKAEKIFLIKIEFIG